MVIRNNVTRLLDARGIEYTTHELPNQKLGALEAAAHIGVEPEQVYKTIVATILDTGKIILALIPGTGKASPKAIAKVVKAKKIAITTLAQAEKLTGLPSRRHFSAGIAQSWLCRHPRRFSPNSRLHLPIRRAMGNQY